MLRSLALLAVLATVPCTAAAQTADHPEGQEAPTVAAPPPPVVPSETSSSSSASEEGVRRERNLRLRLRLLGDDLETLDQRSYAGRYVDAIASMIIGGALIAVAAILDPEEDGIDEGGRRLLYFSGGVSAAEGALSLAFVPSMGDDALRFNAMPDEERREARRKLRFGERTLESAAGQAHADRLVNGLGGVGLGIAYYGVALPLWGLTGSPLDYLLIGYAAMVVVQGVIALFTASAAERMWDIYEETARQHPIGRRRRRGALRLFRPATK